ncbi:MAG TPA: FapA family protein [Candidatus Propionivibrio aalborgensis]|nr:FapA family protein [Candidatus Propionivibrio aalborgensis]
MTEFSGLTLSVDDNRLIAYISASEARAFLEPDSLRALLAEAGFGSWHLSEGALQALIEHFNSSTSELKLPIGERSDASFKLEMAQDAMQVWADFIPSYGGIALDPNDVYQALEETGVVVGIDSSAVSAACASDSAERILVAAGQPAEDGIDAHFEMLVADTRDRTPQVSENGLIDFRELGAIPMVAAEQPLMRRIPPTTGTAGRNVRGEVIEPVPGQDALFDEGLIGAYVDKEDANLLRAVFSGQPVRAGNGVNVEQVLNISHVNMASGNISFDGTVNIEGDVSPGMKVHASGDIVVGEVVDGAELDAGGDIRVAGGIISQARVHAGGSVSARFVESAHVFSGTIIAIDDSALQSELQANNQIVVGVSSPQRGRLAGGSAKAMMLIKTPILGSQTGGVTNLVLGVNPVLEAQYQDLLKVIEKQREEESKLEMLVKHLTKIGDKNGMLERVKASWEQAIKAWAQLLPQRDELERQLALIAGARVEIGLNVVGAVDILFGKKVSRLRKTYETGSFSIEGDRVLFTDPEGNVSPAA